MGFGAQPGEGFRVVGVAWIVGVALDDSWVIPSYSFPRVSTHAFYHKLLEDGAHKRTRNPHFAHVEMSFYTGTGMSVCYGGA